MAPNNTHFGHVVYLLLKMSGGSTEGALGLIVSDCDNSF